MTGLLVVLLGGAAGAVLRAEVVRLLGQPGRLPVGVAVVNLVGAFLLGMVVGAADRMPDLLVLALGTGLLGAFTTYSTWAAELLGLWRTGRRGQAWVFGAGQLLVGVLLADAGLRLGGLL